jgi:hypothetical protein
MGTETKTRNRVKRADIQEAILSGLTEFKLNDSQLAGITALVKAEMKIGSTSETFPPRPNADGVTEYYCSRDKQYHPLEDMVTTKDGESKGYSKSSQEILTATNQKLRELNDETMKALSSGDTDSAIAIAKEVADLTEAKESGAIYTA